MIRSLLMPVDVVVDCGVRGVSGVAYTLSQRGLQIRMFALILFCLALPTGLAWAHPTNQSPPSKPASQVSKMTNADVIQMVKAGLSEQIVITSIRQAPAKDFDLTATGLIALKKADVPDGVIQVMQDLSTSAKSASVGDKTPSDDKEAIVNAVLRQAVSSQSGGALTLSSFLKTNGYEERMTGTYVLEWQADISVQQDIWKAGNAFVGYFESFHVMARQPGPLDSIGMSPKHFNKGTRIHLAGDARLLKTEQGWRIEGLKVKAAQVAAEGGPSDSAPPVAEPTGAASARNLETLSAAVERGEEVVVNIKYNSAIPGYLYLASGKVKVSKASVTFDFTYGLDDFTVSPERILDVVSEPQQNARIHIKAAVKNKKGDRASVRDFYIYSPGAVEVGTGPGGAGGSISCNACDDSMSVLYALLQKVRYPSTSPLKSESAIADPATNTAPLPTVDQILDKYLQAMGGKAAFEKLTTRVSKGSLEQIMGTSYIDGPFESYAKAPNKVAMTMYKGKVQQSFDGNVGWIKNAQGRAYQISGEELVRWQREFDFYREANLRESYAKMTVIRKDKVGGREAYVIAAIPREGKPDTMYFDAQTGFLVRQDGVIEGQKGNPALTEVYFEDYREVDGVKLPFTTRQSGPGYHITVRLHEIKHNVPIDDAKFTKP